MRLWLLVLLCALGAICTAEDAQSAEEVGEVGVVGEAGEVGKTEEVEETEAERIRAQLQVLLPLVEELQQRLDNLQQRERAALAEAQQSGFSDWWFAPAVEAQQPQEPSSAGVSGQPRAGSRPGANNAEQGATQAYNPAGEGGAGGEEGEIDEESGDERAAEPFANAQILYREGALAYNDGDWSTASELHTLFLEKWPEHRLAPNAYYLLAAAKAEQGETLLARQYINALISAYPSHYLIPDALFFVARLERSEALLRKLLETYPDTGAALSARALLSEWQEGADTLSGESQESSSGN